MGDTPSETDHATGDDVAAMGLSHEDGHLDESAGSDPSTPDAVEVVLMRHEPNDKPRRLFSLSADRTLSVTMRGSLDLVEQEPLRCTALRTEARQLIDDACVLPHPNGDIVVLGRLGDARQLSFLRVQDRKVRLQPDLRVCSRV